jgi:hypothetical protein
MYARIGHKSQAHRGPNLDLKTSILSRVKRDKSIRVWTPNDFLDLGSRSAVDKALQRLALAKDIRRIDRGLYDLPRINQLTGKPTNPDYTAVVDAVARREKARLLPDGMTAANQLGLTNAVPAKVIVHTDARLRSIKLDQLVIDFKLTAPSRLYWAGRPAMRIVQALHWLHDILPVDTDSILKRIKKHLHDPKQGKGIREDLRKGLDALPGWMRELVTGLLADEDRSQPSTTKHWPTSTGTMKPVANNGSVRRPS